MQHVTALHYSDIEAYERMCEKEMAMQNVPDLSDETDEVACMSADCDVG